MVNNYDRKYYQSLLKRVNYELKTIPPPPQSQYHQYPPPYSFNSNHNGNNNNILQEARELASKVGLSIESDLRNINIVTTTTAVTHTSAAGTVSSSTNLKDQAAASGTTTGTSSSVSHIPISTTTGGYSNTDHIIVRNGCDERTDRINEYRRQYMIRQRTVTNSETKSYTQKWDKHRVLGERRRRILRDIDLPNAPTEPPPSGYVLFLGQMTTKLRHDRYQRDKTKRVQHDQTKLVQEISNMWKTSLNDRDREYYHNFYVELKKEYQQQLMEYRATGYYTPSTKYLRNHTSVGLWTHIEMSEKNALELEIATYDTVQFPSTHLNETEQLRRIRISQEKRRLKIQQQREALRQQQLAQQSSSTNVGMSVVLPRQRRRRRRSITSTASTATTTTTATASTTTQPGNTPATAATASIEESLN